MNRDLDYVLNYMTKYVKDQYMHDSEPILNYRDIELILKHIYNLQQENKQLKVKSDVLEENNKLLIQQKEQMYEDLDIAYDKIDKAIEYIKEELYEVGGCVHGSDLPHNAIEPILEILGDKE